MNHQKPTVAVIGCGYVGLTTAVLLANCGYKVFAIETDKSRLKSIQSGKSFFYEVGINQLLQVALDSGNLIATDSYDQAVPNADIVFSCVGTPDYDDGSSNLTYVFDVADKTATLMKNSLIFVQKSTVPVGTGKKIEEVLAKSSKSFSYVSNPEFLREGTAISDTLWFDRVVVGSTNKQAGTKIINIYKDLSSHRNALAKTAGIKAPSTAPKGKYILTSLNSAELIKVTANAFLALKISFANSIAKLADQTRADIVEVMDGIGADNRIGRAFLNAGRGYGGGCFPKDVSGLIRSAEDSGVNMEIMHATVAVNDSMPHYIINKVKARLGGSLKGKKVAVLGLAFKPGTSDTRRSPAIVIANTLVEQGAVVTSYDPEATHEAKTDLADEVKLKPSLTDCIRGVDAIFIATDWPEFIDFDYPAGPLIVDCMNCLKGTLPTNKNYIGVGK